MSAESNQPPPMPSSGPIRHDFDQPRSRSKSSLGIWLAVALFVSLIFSAFLSIFFWALAIQSPELLLESFYNQPIGYIEPFEAYTQITRSDSVYSDESMGDPVELGAHPVDVWTRWRLEEYLKRTKNKNPYAVFPSAQSQEEVDERREAFAQFEKEIEPISEEIENTLNLRAFFVDLIVYFLIFATLSCSLVLLLHLAPKAGRT